MTTLSKAGKALQARLTQKFLTSLPEKAQQIAECWRRLESGGWPDEAATQLGIYAHRLSGSAGSYGLDDLGETAASLYRALKSGTNSPANRRLIAERVEALLGQLKSSALENS